MGVPAPVNDRGRHAHLDELPERGPGDHQIVHDGLSPDQYLAGMGDGQRKINNLAW